MAGTPMQGAATAQSWTRMATTAILAIRQSTIRVVTDPAAFRGRAGLSLLAIDPGQARERGIVRSNRARSLLP